MDQLPGKPTDSVAGVSVGTDPEERTIELDRETLDEGVPRDTNDSKVHANEGARKTEIYRNDYESALPEHYKLIRMIGRGGMSEVFLAADERLGRNVAIKFLNSEFRRDPDRMRRFNREARAASALNHPNILIIHDIGENEGVQYIVSEFVDGDTLGSRIAKGKLPIPEAVRISIQVVSALAASHNAGIVHRDIKPDNIMIRRDGSVKILDFGLAKESGGMLYDPISGEARTLEDAATSPGLILGTPQYMSPEQARGKQLDARTDIFSFGVILFEMITANQPFPGTSMVDIIAALISKEPRRLDEFVDDPPSLLKQIIDRTLRKDKADRYGSAEELLADLHRLEKGLAGVPDVSRTTNADELRNTRPNTIGSFLARTPARRNILILFVIGLPLAALVAWWIASRGNAPETRSTSGSMRMVPITNWTSGTSELVASASFSPDGKMIAFAATKTGSTEVWAKPVSGGEAIQVTKNGFYNQYPIWSPDGQEVAFFSRRGGNNGIWRASYSGGEQIQIGSGVGASARPIRWSNSGKIFYQEKGELFTIDEKTGERSQVTNFEAKNLTPRTIEIDPDEKQIAFSIREDGTWKIYVADLRLETPQVIVTSAEQIDEFAWEPDGKAVIYSGAANGAYQVFRSGAGYSKPVQLSNGNLDFFVQDVSADGQNVLYGSVTETSDLWSVNVYDGKQSPLVNEVASEFWGDVSPDGRSVVYQSVSQADRPYRGNVNVSSLDGSKPATLISPEGFAPAWSPDGQWIAFFKRSDAGISIMRSRTTGGDPVKLADGSITPPGYSVTPYLRVGFGHFSWSPDSKTIIFTQKSNGISDVWSSSVEGGESAKLSNNQVAAESYSCPIWSRDGKSVYFISELTPADAPRKRVYRIWSLDPLSKEQKIIFESNGPFRFLGVGKDPSELIIARRLDPTDLSAVPETVSVIVRSLKTSTDREITKLNKVYFNNIHLSHDGAAIAYVTRNGDSSALWIGAIGGERKELISETDPKVLFSSLAWSPDGRFIVFGKQTRTNLLSMLSN